jgi:shikimate dehydrogenase
LTSQPSLGRALHGRAPTGTTRLGAVIGHPIRHSLSPTIYNAAFAAVDLDWVFVAFDVAEGGGGDAVHAMRVLGIDWLSVTMPHKAVAADAVDELTDDARALHAVNCVVSREGRLVGHSTDGAGFVRALQAEVGFTPAGRSCAVLGAGGAARAVVLALARAGASEVVVVNRTRSRAEEAAALAADVARVGSDPDVTGADLVVNATSVGMGGDARSPIDPDRLREGQVVADLVYEPPVTRLLAAAAARGLVTVNGVGMLVQQAGLQFEQVIGQPAPIDAMDEAARSRLDGP